MQASTWVGIGILVLLLLVLGFSVFLFIYAEREYSKVHNWPLYSGFAQIGGKDVTLSCPAGKTMTLERATYSPFGNGSGCSSCEELDVTTDLKEQTDGKNSITLQNIPTSGVWNGTRVCPSGENCASGYVLSGSYSCS
ncbi:hypothetical protein C8_420 [Cannes 8 virus]|uniref:Uncharacterized protein n=1 Tax=Marseillevirus marseillevirus TaxID=694581 RepID=D2XB33_GBMV|nr:hypothetical protein MAR_ORF397 [Marseillevirus marseillevirus]YP_009094855.1 hypothetical protein MEL_354 [Melbournevirus]AGV01769.1 hypothetical protein C8_420 [Cannes 8 virus]AVR53118.1 transmembrane domain-containing protein [Marseillevirus Shanghai 1]ADB04160.1 hypothetical protein MAR_ORF397 [Marseillevirus marseillevirus]AIT54967.1 transmembrane domain-containing protein [Melbournevirus]